MLISCCNVRIWLIIAKVATVMDLKSLYSFQVIHCDFIDSLQRSKTKDFKASSKWYRLAGPAVSGMVRGQAANSEPCRNNLLNSIHDFRGAVVSNCQPFDPVITGRNLPGKIKTTKSVTANSNLLTGITIKISWLTHDERVDGFIWESQLKYHWDVQIAGTL